MSRLFVMVILASVCAVARSDDSFTVPKKAAKVLHKRCLDCHGGDSTEGNVRFDNLSKLKNSERLELLNKAQEQLYFGLMPPEDAVQPSDAERDILAKWASEELKKYGASKLEDKLRKPEYGNYVDHDKLFSGQYADLPAFTYDRRWLISEFIFDVKFNRLTRFRPYLDIDGKRRFVPHLSSGFRLNLTNPFLLPTNSGVRYYANETLSGGHLLTMLTNANDTAAFMVTHPARRDSRFLPAASAIMAVEDAQNKTLASRENFLVQHVEKLLLELYSDKHASLLPNFVPTKIEAADTSKGGKKSNFDAAKPAGDNHFVWSQCGLVQACLR